MRLKINYCGWTIHFSWFNYLGKLIISHENLIELLQMCSIQHITITQRTTHGKISAQPHTTLSIQFLDRENNDKNNTLPLGKQICLAIVWRCA